MKTVLLYDIELDKMVVKTLESFGLTLTTQTDDPNYIIYSGSEKIDEIEQTYDLSQGEIKLIHIGEVNHKDKFFMNGGSLIISEDKLDKEESFNILEQFFSGDNALRLAQRTSFEPEQEPIIITNHLQTGLSFDTIVTSAFDHDFDPLLVRGYLDHTIGFFAHLVQSGLGAVPFELEWCFKDNIFVLNTYLKVRNFSKEFIVDSLSEVGGSKPLNYLLSVASKSCEHLDISYFEKSDKLCFTAYWDRSAPSFLPSISVKNIYSVVQKKNILAKKMKTLEDQLASSEKSFATQENLKKKEIPNGFLIKAQFESKELIENPDKTKNILETLVKETVGAGESVGELTEKRLKQIIDAMDSKDKIEGLSESGLLELKNAVKSSRSTEALQKEVATASVDDDEDVSTVVSERLVEEVTSRASKNLSKDKVKALLEDETSTVLKGQKEKEEFKRVIRSEKEKPETINRIKGEFADLGDNFKTVIRSSSAEESKKGLFRNLIDSKVSALSSKLPGLDQGGLDKFVESILPRELELGLEEFALGKGKDLSDLSDDEINEFQDQKIPNIISNLLESESLQEEYSESIETNEPWDIDFKFRDKLREKFIDSNSIDDLEDEEFLAVVKSTLEDSIASDIVKIDSENHSQQDKEKMLSKVLGGFVTDKEEVQRITSSSIDSAQEIRNEIIHQSFKESQDSLPTETSSPVEKELFNSLKAEKALRKKIENELAVAKGQVEAFKNTAKRIEETQRKVAETIVKDQSDLTEDNQNPEDKVKMLELESRQKDALFGTEIAKLERTIKGKEIILEKTKAAFETRLQSFAEENKELKQAVQKLEENGSKEVVSSLKQQLISLKKENDLLAKSSSLVKERLDAVSKGQESQARVDRVDDIIEENKKMKNINTELYNKSQVLEKDKKALESRLASLELRESNLREEAIKAKQRSIDAEAEMRLFKQTESSRMNDAVAAQAKDHDSMISKEYNALKSQNLQLQKKIKDLTDRATGGGAGSNGKPNLSAKERHLEKDKKRLQTELSKNRADLDDAKKVMMKFKGENIKMKNELEKAKRDNDRMERKLRSLASKTDKKAA